MRGVERARGDGSARNCLPLENVLKVHLEVYEEVVLDLADLPQ